MRYIDTEELYRKRERWGHSQELWTSVHLKEDFRATFYNKCWYTEVLLVGQDVHIDHFRPKAEVAKFKQYHYNEPLKDCGYHWLKNDIHNYRVSCIYANRITGDGGKGTFFPLKEGSQLLTENGQENETPMLLDPLKKEDVILITFFKGQVLCATEEDDEKQRVEVSREIYNLIEPTITAQRTKTWTNIERIVTSYRENQISRDYCLVQLKDAVSRESPFSACAIACINSLAPDEIKNELDLDL